MVRIFIDKNGSLVDDTVLAALKTKLTSAGLNVKTATNEVQRGVIIIDTDLSGAEVMQAVRSNKNHVVCGGCSTVWIRGVLPEEPFRCACGKWLLMPIKI